MSIRIRVAAAAEADAVCAIDPRVVDIPTRRGFIERSVAAGECHVAVDGASIVGYALFDRSLFEQPFVSLLHVEERRRRCGIGAALMRYIESICPGEKLFTSTNASNTPMRRLCEKLGFIESGQIEHLDEGDPEMVYFKRLTGKGES